MTACTCAEIRATHRLPAPDDPNQTPSQVKCPACCAASWDGLLVESVSSTVSPEVSSDERTRP